MIYDLIVIGLGPAGSTAAYTATKQGLKVLAFDKAQFPRHKLCGGAVSTRIDDVLDFDLSSVIRERVNTGVLDFGGDRMSFTLEKPFIYLVERPEFDSFLLQKAVKAGAHIRQGEGFLSLTETEKIVQIRTPGGEYRCRYLLGCDGALGRVGRYLNPSPIQWKGFGLEKEVVGNPFLCPAQGSVLIRFGDIPHGYGWIFPKGEKASVGLARFSGRWKGAKKAYFQFLSLYGLNNNPQGHPLPVYSSSPQFCRARGRIALAGDAAFWADDFLGEGIYFAIKSGKLAAESIAAALDGGALEELYGKALSPIYEDLETSRKLAEAVYSFPRLTYWIIKLFPYLFPKYLESLTQEGAYRDFYRKCLPRWMQKGLKIVYNLKNISSQNKGDGYGGQAGNQWLRAYREDDPSSGDQRQRSRVCGGQ